MTLCSDVIVACLCIQNKGSFSLFAVNDRLIVEMQ